MKKSKIIISLILVSVMVMTASGCSFLVKQEEEATQPTTTTTTEPTTVTTTEDLSTTFAEKSTTRIYKGLIKDDSDSYPYEIEDYTTYYRTSDKTRTANLKAAASKINNIVVPNGEVFSFNQVVGKRTITAGYETAKVIANGEFVDGLGGGVCQVSSTVFQAVLRSNMEIVRRTNHSLTISYVPLGADATVQWNSKDFQFRNNLGCDIRLKMTCENGKLTCSVYAKENKKIGKVNINITKSNGTYTLTRTVDGKKNYTTKSKYQSPKPSTTKAKPTTTKAVE